MIEKEPVPQRLRGLMARFIQLGQLLPAGNDIEADDEARDRGRLVLAEMDAVQAEIDAILTASGLRRQAPR